MGVVRFSHHVKGGLCAQGAVLCGDITGVEIDPKVVLVWWLCILGAKTGAEGFAVVQGTKGILLEMRLRIDLPHPVSFSTVF